MTYKNVYTVTRCNLCL